MSDVLYIHVLNCPSKFTPQGALRPKEKRSTEAEVVREHHWLNGRESLQTPGDSEGHRSLARCTSWGHRVRHDLATEQQQKATLALSLETTSLVP